MPPNPGLSTLISTWSGEPLPWIGLGAGTLIYLALVQVVNRAHPGAPTHYFLDSTGIIRDRYFGPMTHDLIAASLGRIL